MSNRSVKFVPALFAGVVAGANLATDDGSSGPGSGTGDGPGSGSRYPSGPGRQRTVAWPRRRARPPRAAIGTIASIATTKRQCWYLREESDKADDKFARAAAPPASAPAPPPAAAEPASRAGANDDLAQVDRRRARRMGFPASPRRTKFARQSSSRKRSAAAPAPAVQNSPRAAMPNVLAPAPLSSMRWNDTPATSASSNSADLQTARRRRSAGRPAAAAS